MDCSKPGFPVHHQLPEATRTHVHQVGDVIQPFHPLLSPSFPTFNARFPSIRVFYGESVLWIRWPKYWSFSFSISPSNEYSRLISLRMDWLDLLQSKGLSRVFSNTTVQKHQFFGSQLSLKSNSHNHTWPVGKTYKCWVKGMVVILGRRWTHVPKNQLPNANWGKTLKGVHRLVGGPLAERRSQL